MKVYTKRGLILEHFNLDRKWAYFVGTMSDETAEKVYSKIYYKETK